MFMFRRRVSFFYCFLLFTTLRPPCVLVNGRFVFELVNSSQIENETKLLIQKMLEGTTTESAEEWRSLEVINCTWDEINGTSEINGTNVTCVNGTWNMNGTDASWNGTRVLKKDRFKFAQIIPILIHAAIIIIKVVKFCITIAKIIIKIGWTIFKAVGKIALKAIKFSVKAGKLIGKYVVKGGKIVLEAYDAVEPLIDPVMDYYKSQQESKRLAEEAQRFREQDMQKLKQEWAAAASEVPEEQGEEPEWLPNKNPELLDYGWEHESDNMPGWLISIIIITLVALIVAMPTTAFVLTNQVQQRRRRRRKGPKSKKVTSKKTQKSKKSSKKSSSKQKKDDAEEAEMKMEAAESKAEEHQSKMETEQE